MIVKTDSHACVSLEGKRNCLWEHGDKELGTGPEPCEGCEPHTHTHTHTRRDCTDNPVRRRCPDFFRSFADKLQHHQEFHPEYLSDALNTAAALTAAHRDRCGVILKKGRGEVNPGFRLVTEPTKKAQIVRAPHVHKPSLVARYQINHSRSQLVSASLSQDARRHTGKRL